MNKSVKEKWLVFVVFVLLVAAMVYGASDSF